jgi:hypothetical protein
MIFNGREQKDGKTKRRKDESSKRRKGLNTKQAEFPLIFFCPPNDFLSWRCLAARHLRREKDFRGFKNEGE